MRRKRAQKFAKQFTKQIKKQLHSFGTMGDECLACQKPFDRKSKEHAESWKIVVRKDKEQTNLYCPVCWQAAQDAIKQVEEADDNRICKEEQMGEITNTSEPV